MQQIEGTGDNLHEHKGVKVLNAVENGLDNVGSAVDLWLVLS